MKCVHSDTVQVWLLSLINAFTREKMSYCHSSFWRLISGYLWRTSGKHFRDMYTPLYAILYSKAGVSFGSPIFRIIAPKHTLWVLVRTAGEAVLTSTHNVWFG